VFSVHRTCAAGYPVPGYRGYQVEALPEAAQLASSGRVYGAAVWAGGSRREWGFIAARFCVLDFDEGVSKAKAHDLLQGYAYALLPTKSDGIAKVSSTGKHKPAQDRFRVILPFDRVIWDTEVFRYNMKQQIARFGSDALPYDGGRVWQPSPRIEYISNGGKSLDVILNVPLEETQSYQQKKAAEYTAARVATGILPRRVIAFMEGRVAPGARNDELFKCACILFSFGWTVEKVKRLVLSIPQIADHDKIDSTLKSAAKRTGAAFF
jgi:hypothetical protein